MNKTENWKLDDEHFHVMSCWGGCALKFCSRSRTNESNHFYNIVFHEVAHKKEKKKNLPFIYIVYLVEWNQKHSSEVKFSEQKTNQTHKKKQIYHSH